MLSLSPLSPVSSLPSYPSWLGSIFPLSRQISAELSAEQRLVELRSERRSSRRGSDVLTELFLLAEGWVHAERVARRRR